MLIVMSNVLLTIVKHSLGLPVRRQQRLGPLRDVLPLISSTANINEPIS